jgi:O-antigen/teichoic acid export membrane protein
MKGWALAVSALGSAFRSRRARQAGTLYVSLVLSLVLGIAVSVINTRFLDPKAFGDFKFLQTIWTVGVLFVTFGFFTTGGNLLAQKQTGEAEKSLIGSLLVMAAGISLIFTLLMLIASFPIGWMYETRLADKIRMYAVLLFVFPLQIYLQEVLRGSNDIHNLALLNVLPQLIYIPAALLVNHFYGYSLDMALLLYLLGMALTVLAIIVRTNPEFTQIRHDISVILNNNREIGSHIYIATLVTTPISYLGQFTLAYFWDTRLVGEFALALTITIPLALIPNTIATTFFKHFASVDRIPRKIIVAATVLSLTTLLGYLIVIKPLILLLYTEKFTQVVPLAYICAIGYVARGMGDLFNRYLLSNGQTSVLRTNALHLGIISIIGYVLFVIWWDVTGAAITKLVVDIIYLLSMTTYYVNRASKNRLEKTGVKGGNG